MHEDDQRQYQSQQQWRKPQLAQAVLDTIPSSGEGTEPLSVVPSSGEGTEPLSVIPSSGASSGTKTKS